MSERRDQYEWHSANGRAVFRGFESTCHAAKGAIRSGDHEQERFFTIVAAMLLGAVHENRLKRVTAEPGGFSSAERRDVERGSIVDQWSMAIDIGFRRRYNKWLLDEVGLGVEAAHRRNALQNALEAHFRPIVEMRNTLAHGQWSAPLNAKETAIREDMRRMIDDENVLTLSIKQRLSVHFETLVGGLVSTSSAFERDFSINYGKFESALEELQRADFGQYRRDLLASSHRGQTYKSGNNTSASKVRISTLDRLGKLFRR